MRACPKSEVASSPRPRQRERVAAKRPGEGGQNWQTATHFHPPSPPAPLRAPTGGWSAGEGRLFGQALRARHGHTLIECTVALTMIGVILNAVALTLHATRQANRRVRNEADSQLELGRFAAQWRGDAHEARSAKLENPKEAGARPAVLSLALADDRTAEYTLQAECIERVLRRGQAVLHRETYRLPGFSTGRWLLRAGERSPLVSLVLESEAGQIGREAVALPYRVDAAVHLFADVARKAKP